MKILEKIIHAILNVLILIIFIVLLVILYNYAQLQIFHKDYTNLFGYAVFEVSTGSMRETLNIYDVIIVKITKDVDVDDIITFKKDDETITHRIAKITKDEIITKGDANNTEDEPITLENVIGKVVSVCPKLGIWIKVLSDPKILISIFITLVLIGKSFSKEK